MPEVSHPVRTSSFVSPVWLREDLTPETASAYWAGPHAEIVRRLPTLIEYVQRHLSATDHGFWPPSRRVGTRIPANWRVEGFAEVRFKNTAAALMSPPRMRAVFLDEQNLFQRVLGQPTGPNRPRPRHHALGDRRSAAGSLPRTVGAGGAKEGGNQLHGMPCNREDLREQGKAHSFPHGGRRPTSA